MFSGPVQLYFSPRAQQQELTRKALAKVSSSSLIRSSGKRRRSVLARARLSFTVCTAGKAKVFMNRMAGHLGCEVACYNEPTAVFDDGTLGFRPGKARLILDSDSGPEKDPLTPSTNRSRARCIAPNLDSSLIAFVGKPAKPATP